MGTMNYPEGYVEVKNICPNRVTEDFLDFMETTLEDCKGKNITSIGGGFGIFEMDASKAGANITIVDPIFADPHNIPAKIQENYNRLSEKKGVCAAMKLTEHLSKTIDEVSKQLEDLLIHSPTSDILQHDIDKLKYDLCRRIERRNELIKRQRNLQTQLTHLLSRENNYKNSNITLNPSVGNHITNIGEGSQNLVLINHTLSHIYKKHSLEDIKQTLLEGQRLLYDDGKLWIIDYKQDMEPIEKELQHKNPSRYKTNYGSFAYRFDKKSLTEFIDQYFK